MKKIKDEDILAVNEMLLDSETPAKDRYGYILKNGKWKLFGPITYSENVTPNKSKGKYHKIN